MQLKPVLGVGTAYAPNSELASLQAAQTKLGERMIAVKQGLAEVARQQKRVELRFEEVIRPILEKMISLLRVTFPNAIVSSRSDEQGQLSLMLTANSEEEPLSAEDVRQKVEDVLQKVICGNDSDTFQEVFSLDCQPQDGKSLTVRLALSPKMLAESEQPSVIRA